MTDERAGQPCPRCGRESDGGTCRWCAAVGAVSEDTTNVPAAGGIDESPTQIRSERPAGDRPYSGYVAANEYRPAPQQPPRSYPAQEPMTQPPTQPSGGAGGSKVLVALVAIVSLLVAGMLGYLFVHHQGSKGSTDVAPSVNPSSAGTSASSTSSTAAPTSSSTSDTSSGSPSSTSSTHDADPAPSTVTQTQSSQASPSQTGLGDVPGYVTQAGGYAIGRSGSSLTVYKDPGSGAQKVNTITLGGSGSNNGLSMMQLPGCSAPIIVWNAATPQGSAAYGVNSSGTYHMFHSTGELNMTPEGGDGSVGTTFGVYDHGSFLAYKDKKGQPKNELHVFTGCESDGTTLHYDRTGE